MNDKIKVYLITGVAGFIGANLAKRILNLKNEKIHIIGIDNLSSLGKLLSNNFVQTQQKNNLKAI